jgi:hypothetical protein
MPHEEVILTRDMILKSDDLAKEKVSVPEWGGSVYVRCLTGVEREQWEGIAIRARDAKNYTKVRTSLLTMCLVDEKGNRLFADQDVRDLGQKSAKAMDRLVDVALRISGISEGEIEKMEGN